ncbi:MAG: hypothetical protein VX464_06585 [Pseudomonadota bacterium]|nr:hypothetical protein [Pseudomonadota bacterium]
MKRHLVACAVLALLALPVPASSDSVPALSVWLAAGDIGALCAEPVKAAGLAKDTGALETLFPVFQVGEALKSGQSGDKIFGMPLNWLTRTLPGRLSLANEPYAFRDVSHFSAYMSSDLLHDQIQDFAAGQGVRVLAVGYSSQYFVLSTKPLPEKKGYVNLKIAGSNAPWFSVLGAVPQQIPWAEMAPAVSLGMLDAAILPLKLSNAFSKKSVEMLGNSPRLSYIQSEPISVWALVFAMNETAFQGLPVAVRDALTASAQAAARDCSSKLLHADKTTFDELASDTLKVYDLTDRSIVDAIRNARSAAAAEAGWTAEDLRRLSDIQ